MNFKKNLENAFFLCLTATALLLLLVLAVWGATNAPVQPSFFQNLASQLLSPSSSTSPCQRPCKPSKPALQVVQRFEGFSRWAYYDVVGKKTIGYGHAYRPGEVIQEPLLPAQAEELLERDMASAAAAVNKLTVVPLQQNQFDAVLSFTYNLGSGTLKKSTLVKKVNAQEHAEVPPEFLRYVYAGGKEYSGLVMRRQAEANLYAGR